MPMQYSRLGLYVERKKNKKEKPIEKKFDYVNIFLFILLISVVLFFIFGK